MGVELLSTGGTAKALRDAGLKVIDVSEYTGAPELFEGRLKTLHPMVHGGLLHRRDDPDHVADAKKHGIPPIDLVVVNLYPFEETVAKPGVTLEEAIENIDIGGPSMLRSAAKNHSHVTVIVLPSDYPVGLAEMRSNGGDTTKGLREQLAVKVFLRTSQYDGAITNFLGQCSEGAGCSFTLSLPLEQELRYGDNPHQKCSLYGNFASCFTQLQGKELSYTNIIDIEAAAELMRKQGLAKADKKAARVAAEGVIVLERSADGRSAAMVEVNCETDFVAREADFQSFSAEVAQVVLAAGPATGEALAALNLASGETVDERRRALVAKIGENISVRRHATLSSSGQLGAYRHGTRIGALVAIEGGDAALAHDLAMHVAATNPSFLSVADVPADVVAKEREIETEKALAEGKPADIVAKMVEGRIRKTLNERVLLGQPFVKDPDQTIEKLLKAAKAEVKSFQRFEVGAGIEKKQDDFVGEVMAQVKASSGAGR